MNYEKKYNKTIESIKRIYDQADSYGKELIEKEFPELRESEDERIRKEMIFFFQEEIPQCSIQEHADKMKEFIAWLEKQGEQKPKFRVGDTIKCKYDDRRFTIKSVNLDKGIYTYIQEGCGNDIDYADEEFELVEQKTADKVEPKFKVGDVIRNKWSNRTKTIISIDDYQYTVDDGMPAQPFKVNINAQDNWELVEENPAWSKEDDKMP